MKKRRSKNEMNLKDRDRLGGQRELTHCEKTNKRQWMDQTQQINTTQPKKDL